MSRNGSLILIADPDRGFVEQLKNALELKQYRCLSSHDGEETIIVSQHVRPDVVLLSMNMPNGNGLEVLRSLRSGESMPEVLMLSDQPSPLDAVNALQSGASDFLVKSLDLDDRLDAALERSLERHQRRVQRGKVRQDKAARKTKDDDASSLTFDDFLVQVNDYEFKLAELQQEKVAFDKMAARETLIKQVAYEINHLLTVLHSHLQLMQADLSENRADQLSPRIEESLREIEAGAAHVHRLLEFSSGNEIEWDREEE